MHDYTVYMHISPNNKRYIGITHLKPSHRYSKNGNGYKRCPLFYRAIQKYGWNNFKHIIICDGLSKEIACEKEQELINYYKSNMPEFGYNCSLGGESGSYGHRHTEEQRKKISLTGKGRIVSEETRRKIGKANSVSLRGRIISQEVRDKISKNNARAMAGKHLSDETKRKISEANKGNQFHKGFKHSAETKEKMRLAKLGKKKGPWTEEERKAHMEANERRRQAKAKNQTV